MTRHGMQMEMLQHSIPTMDGTGPYGPIDMGGMLLGLQSTREPNELRRSRLVPSEQTLKRRRVTL